MRRRKRLLFSILVLSVLPLSLARANLGHRMGGDIYKPENTLFCLKLALTNLQDKQDFAYVELDVQESADGKLIVFHDTDSISRIVPSSPTNIRVVGRVLAKKRFDKIRIRDLNVGEIKKLRLENEASIPTIDEVLDACVKWNLRKPLLIEIKMIYSDQARKQLLELATAYRDKIDLNFLAFPSNFRKSFPDNERWGETIKALGFSVYTAKKPKDASHDLVSEYKDSHRTFLTILEQTEFAISSNRSRNLPIQLKLHQLRRDGGQLRIGVFHGYDDTGDGGVVLHLYDKRKRQLGHWFSDSKGWKWFTITLKNRRPLILVLSDTDTSFSGEHPGNGGAIKVACALDQP